MTGPGEAAAQLGAELRRLRDLAGLSGRDLAARVGISQPTLSRIEAGSRVPSLPEVTAWANAAGADERTQAFLARLAEAAMTAIAPWRSALGGRAHFQDDAAELEVRARDIRAVTHSLIPGLLQTAAYTRALFTHFSPVPGHDDAAALAARLRRQEALYDLNKTFQFLLTEAALRWQPGPGIRAAQCAHIASIATLPNVRLGLLPLELVAGPYTDFTLYEPAGDDEAPVVTVELPHARLVLSDAADVSTYRRLVDRWQGIAIGGTEADLMLRQIGAEGA